jgi:hypothetical protein
LLEVRINMACLSVGLNIRLTPSLQGHCIRADTQALHRRLFLLRGGMAALWRGWRQNGAYTYRLRCGIMMLRRRCRAIAVVSGYTG